LVPGGEGVGAFSSANFVSILGNPADKTRAVGGSKLRVTRIDWSVKIGRSTSDRTQRSFPFPGDEVQLQTQVQDELAQDNNLQDAIRKHNHVTLLTLAEKKKGANEASKSRRVALQTVQLHCKQRR
jgi:hypothetical protein